VLPKRTLYLTPLAPHGALIHPEKLRRVSANMKEDKDQHSPPMPGRGLSAKLGKDVIRLLADRGHWHGSRQSPVDRFVPRQQAHSMTVRPAIRLETTLTCNRIDDRAVGVNIIGAHRGASPSSRSWGRGHFKTHPRVIGARMAKAVIQIKKTRPSGRPKARQMWMASGQARWLSKTVGTRGGYDDTISKLNVKKSGVGTASREWHRKHNRQHGKPSRPKANKC